MNRARLFLTAVLAGAACATSAPRPERTAPPVAATSAAPAAAPPKGLAGVGARPLTDRLAATYFIRSVNPSGDYVMDLVVFMKGEPGWTRRKTKWTFDTSPVAAFSSFVFGEAQFRVDLDPETGVVKLLDQMASVSNADVFVVDGVGSPAPKVIYREHQDLRAPFSSDPIRGFLARSAQLRQAVGLSAPAQESASLP
ncbi:MAG TPA: hypothetical protein VH560_07100 [Polyangia bacterium]|jgi:hypothetical protein|nr:hypothetical protein [Polyangia bacterium]